MFDSIQMKLAVGFATKPRKVTNHLKLAIVKRKFIMMTEPSSTATGEKAFSYQLSPGPNVKVIHANAS